MFGQDMTRIEELIAKATGQIASKATISSSTNIAAYDLEPLLKQVYPVLAPFRNKYLPRTVSPIGGTAHNAKRLTAINPAAGGLGIAEGLRGASISVVEQDFSAIFRTVGQEADITFEAEDLARGFDDAMAVRTVSLFNSNLMEEERLVLFGNGGNITVAGGSAQTALGTPNAPVLSRREHGRHHHRSDVSLLGCGAHLQRPALRLGRQRRSDPDRAPQQRRLDDHHQRRKLERLRAVEHPGHHRHRHADRYGHRCTGRVRLCLVHRNLEGCCLIWPQ